MLLPLHPKVLVTPLVIAALLFCAALSRSAPAQGESSNHEPTNLTVIVKEADTGEPISQARITLQFTVPSEHGGRGKKFVFNAKSDAQGRCKLMDINKGPILLTVTAIGRQSYGKELQLEKDGQVFEVRLKKPQPLI